LIVDDHPLFAKGLADLLKLRGIEAVGQAGAGLETLEMAREMRPDVVLTDIPMPRCDGLAATRLINAEFPATKIIMIAASEDDRNLSETVKSGASGYVLKDVDTDALMGMLPDLGKGEAAFSPGLTAKILAEFTRLGAELNAQDGQAEDLADGRGKGVKRPTGGDLSTGTESVLMPRQLQVLRLIASGMSYKEVGSALFISERTVKYHMKQILDRLHLQNRSQVLAYAARMRIGNPEHPLLS